MEMSRLLKSAREQSGMSLRALAQRAKTSHSTLSAYESGRIEPSTSVATRIFEAAGYRLSTTIEPQLKTANGHYPGDELAELLALGELLPRRTRARHLDAPMFPRS